VTVAELPAMFESPLKITLITVEPKARDEVVTLALPLLSWTVPNTVVPALKVTGPAGVTVGEVILAVKVTACPCFEGFSDELIVAALVVCNTV